MAWLRELTVDNVTVILTLNKLRLPFQVQAYQPSLSMIDRMLKVTFATDHLKVCDELVMHLLNADLDYDDESSDDSAYQVVYRQGSGNNYVAALAAVPDPLRQASYIQCAADEQGIVLDLLRGLQPEETLRFGIFTGSTEDNDDVWDAISDVGNPAEWRAPTVLPSDMHTLLWPEQDTDGIPATEVSLFEMPSTPSAIPRMQSVVKRGNSLSLYGKTGAPRGRYFEWKSWRRSQGGGRKS